MDIQNTPITHTLMNRVILVLFFSISVCIFSEQFSLHAQDGFELRSNHSRIEYKDKIGDKIPDPIEYDGIYGVMINTKLKVISIISNYEVRSTSEIVNIEKINNLTIFLLKDSKGQLDVLVVSDLYYYYIYDGLTSKYTIVK